MSVPFDKCLFRVLRIHELPAHCLGLKQPAPLTAFANSGTAGITVKGYQGVPVQK